MNNSLSPTAQGSGVCDDDEGSSQPELTALGYEPLCSAQECTALSWTRESPQSFFLIPHITLRHY